VRRPSAAQRIRLAGVDRDAGAAAIEREGAHVMQAPLAAGDDRQPAIEMA
jgi:hypothetical protein